MAGAFGDLGPARGRLGARRRQVDDRPVQRFERGPERWSNAGAAQRRVDQGNVDLYRARLARPPAHQRSKRRVLSRRDLPQPDGAGWCIGLSPLEVPPQPAA